MRVIFRLALVLALTCLAGWAAWFEGQRLFGQLSASDSGNRRGMGRAGGFRAPEVAVDSLRISTVNPVIHAYGRIASRARLALRIPVAGTVAYVSPTLADGASVTAGTVLIRLDDTEARANLEIAEADLSRAELGLRDTTRQMQALTTDIALLERIRKIRQDEVNRIAGLVSKGSGLQTDLDTATLSLISAEQNLASNQTDLANLAAQKDQQALDIDDAKRRVVTARRTVSDLELRAGIDGTYHGLIPVLGETLASGSEPGVITDLTSLLVRLELTAQEIARATAENGGLRPLDVTLGTPGGDAQYRATLNHVTLSSTDDTTTARQVIAYVDPTSCPCPLPGDFVSAAIHEPPIKGVAVLPAAALSFDGKLLVLAADDRLEEQQMQVLRRLGDMVVVTPPPGMPDYVVERAPQLGAGLQIAPMRPSDTRAPLRPAGGQAEAGSGPRAPFPQGGPAIKLEPERRAALIARVEASDQMPDRARQRMVQMLKQDDVPEALVKRLEAQN